VHYLILLALHGMTDTLKPLLLGAKSAFVSLGTPRTLELITLHLAADAPSLLLCNTPHIDNDISASCL